MNPRRTTSADVAARAGVSRATVSYVLNSVPNQSIPDVTRQRVLEAAIELDYTPHAAARALRAGESKLVLLVNTGVPYGTNLSVMIDALAEHVSAAGRSLVIWQQKNPADLAATLAHLQPVVVLALGRLRADQLELLARSRIPYVEAGTDSEEPIDHAAVLQVRHLAARGHHRIGCLTTTEPRLELFAAPRVAAVRATCAELGLAPPEVAGLPAPDLQAVDAVAVTLDRWTSRPDPVTAVACYNDELAAIVLAAADRAGIAVPSRLAVVGLDDEPMSAYTRPALTTVRLQMADYAHDLWRHAAAELAGDPLPPASRTGHMELVARAST